MGESTLHDVAGLQAGAVGIEGQISAVVRAGSLLAVVEASKTVCARTSFTSSSPAEEEAMGSTVELGRKGDEE